MPCGDRSPVQGARKRRPGLAWTGARGELFAGALKAIAPILALAPAGMGLICQRHPGPAEDLAVFLRRRAVHRHYRALQLEEAGRKLPL